MPDLTRTYLDKAHATVAGNGKAVVVAKAWDLDAANLAGLYRINEGREKGGEDKTVDAKS